MSPKKSVCAFNISGGTAAPHRPQNLCPLGTPLEQERQTKFLACSINSSWESLLKSIGPDPFAAGAASFELRPGAGAALGDDGGG
jgi:hypothetical protein